ncbi:MAG: NAD(P)-binding domain-containing protein [Acidipropionibacterium sp.]|jgi:pyrroline-5-carboxylate reductase|nr:NAD(P)-binding domain-containing protein [Acidipropionibacterium sp.]
MSSHLGIIGFGQMGGAIGAGLVSHEALPADHVTAWDLLRAARRRAEEAGVSTTESIAELVGRADVILLAVKPQDATVALDQAGDGLDGKAVISIVAGWDMATLTAHLPAGPRVLTGDAEHPGPGGRGSLRLLGGDDRHRRRARRVPALVLGHRAGRVGAREADGRSHRDCPAGSRPMQP